MLDWAGTTVDFGSLAPALQELFAAADLTLSEAETRQHMGLPKKEHIRGILSLPRISSASLEKRGAFPAMQM